MNYLKKLLLSLLIIPAALSLCSVPAVAKKNVTYLGNNLVEVTADGINIRSGAGTQYPLAHFYSEDWNNRRVKNTVAQAYKGSRFWVKDAGDWWEIDNPLPASGDSKRFISKKYCKQLQSDDFDLDSITSPQVWARAEKINYGDDEEDYEMTQTSIVTIYPGGLVVAQNYTPEGDWITIGKIIKVVRNLVHHSINTSVGTTGDEVAPDTPLKLWTMTDYQPPCLMWEIGENNRSSFKFNGETYDYVDISGVSPERWNELKKELENAKYAKAITQSHDDPEAFNTRDDLSGYVRVK